MLLSSYQRLLRYCGGDTILADKAQNRQQLMGWLTAISVQIENWLNRGLQIQDAIEYYDIRYHYFEFYPLRIPVTTIASIYTDSTGMWIGGESKLSEISYYPGTNGSSIVLNFARPFEAKRGLRVSYTGGLALDGVRSVYGVTYNGTFVVGKFVYGDITNSIGIVRAVTSTSLTIEVLYGTFQLGETVYLWDTEDSAGTSNATATLDTATSLALAESTPAITRACEMQLRYMWKNKEGEG